MNKKTTIEKFREDLKKTKMLLGLTQQELAKKVGTSQAQISRALNGRSYPNSFLFFLLWDFIYEPPVLKDYGKLEEPKDPVQAVDEETATKKPIKAKTPRTRKRSCRFTEEELAEMDEKAKDIVL